LSENFELDDYEELLRSLDDCNDDATTSDEGEYHHKPVKKIGAYDRTALLLEAGVSYQSMHRVYKEIQKIQKTMTKPEDPWNMDGEEDDKKEDVKPKLRGLGRLFSKKTKVINPKKNIIHPKKNITGSCAA